MYGGRYEIIEKLGGGGMAIVYLARDTFLDRLVAIKVLRDEYLEDPEFVRRFHKEAKAVASLSHPNIVSIYDFEASGSPTYLVMEYVEGKTIKEMIRENGPFSWETVAELGIQIANGLDEAHNAHIVHKDVKPHNILLDKNGLVKVTDFGIAQMVSSATITHNKGILGSAHYFSPEQARGEAVSLKSDIYSMGVVLYEMATGQVPFGGDNPVTVALKHLQEEPEPPRNLHPEIPQGLEDVILRALVKEPAERFDSMAELAMALEEVLRGAGGVGRSNNYKKVDYRPPTKKIYKEADVPTEEMTLALPRALSQKNVDSDYTQSYKNVPTTNQAINQRKVQMANLIITIFVIAALAMVGMFALKSVLTTKDTTVPTIVDMTSDEAAALLADGKLKLMVIREVSHDEILQGHIISQEPKAGTTVKEGREIQVVLSKGTDKIPVPKVIGLAEEDATAAIAAADLAIGNVSKAYNDDYPSGQVVSQSPKEGQGLAKGEKVDLTISMGKEKPPNAAVPELRGLTPDGAKTVLANAKLTIGTMGTEESWAYEKGQISSQSYAPGSQVAEGASINVMISNGPGPNGEKTTRIEFLVPSNGLISLERIDKNGTTVVYTGEHSADDYFSQPVTYVGSGTLNIYINHNLFKTKPLQ